MTNDHVTFPPLFIMTYSHLVGICWVTNASSWTHQSMWTKVSSSQNTGKLIIPKKNYKSKKFQQFLETIQREKWTRCFYLGWAMGLGGYQQLWPTSATHVFTFPSHPFPSYFDIFCIYLDSDRGDYFPDCIIWNPSTGHCVEVVLYSDCKDVTNLIWDSKVKYSISPQKAYLVISLGSAISSSLTVSRKLEVNQPKCWRSASTNNVFQTYVFPQIDMVHTR